MLPRARPWFDVAAARVVFPRLLSSLTQRLSGFSASVLVHALAFLGLALLTFAIPVNRMGAGIKFADRPGEAAIDSLDPGAVSVDIPDITPARDEFQVPDPGALEATTSTDPIAGEESGVESFDLGAALSSAHSAGRGALARRRGGGIEGRAPAARAALLAGGGGDGGTESALHRALRWLVAHQQLDGGWSFDHTTSPCKGQCRNPGNSPTTTGATGVVLLTFLGAGQTHEEGEYQDAIRQGLYYLSGRILDTPHGGDLQQGTMYGHALATWALTEAYAMTGDESLRTLAQDAVDFTVYAQDTVGGGWRYFPGQPGDTSVTGWQLMALKSADLAYLNVPPQSFQRASKFLDGVQSDGGSRYGYQSSEGTETMAAVGVLCRMFSGWRRDQPALELAAQQLAALGPSPDNMYFNYYATQVLFQYGGPYWEGWNQSMKELLATTQATRGHEAGSWYFSGGQCEKGGRLFSTALAAMTLEVYYRYLPLYRPTAVEDP